MKRDVRSHAYEGPTLASWAQKIRQSALQDTLLLMATHPDIISFALGLPATELFPRDIYAQAAEHVLATNPSSLQYGSVSLQLKMHIVALMELRGISCKEEQVFLTTGSQQGLSLLAHLLLDQRGQVLVEETTYTGLLQVITPFQPEILTVPTNRENGIDVEAVESLLKSDVRPAFIYTITDGHNPLGMSMSQANRIRLVELASQYQVPIIEDDACGFLSYDGVPMPPLRALDNRWVYYVGTFSKILAPALRVGWLIVPEVLLPRLAAIKEASDLDTATFAQHTISAYLDTGHLIGHLATLRREYGLRRDAMLDALHTHFPEGTHWRKPPSGLYIWVELPCNVDTHKLLKIAIETEDVAFIPGSAFCAGDNHYAAHCIRLNFSNCTPERIDEGIARLARLLKTTDLR